MTRFISVLLVLSFATADAALEEKPGLKPSVDFGAAKPRPCVLPKQQPPQHQPLPRCPNGFLGRMIQGSTAIRCNPGLFADTTPVAFPLRLIVGLGARR